MNQEEQIIYWSDRILLHLLELKRSKYPELTFWLRSRNNQGRLDKGYWFQGSYYISIGLVQKNDTEARLKQVGLVFNFQDETPTAYVELSFRNETDGAFFDCYQEIMKRIGGFKQRGNLVSYHKFLTGENFIEVIDLFFEKEWVIFLDAFNKYGLLKELLIPEEDFKNSLDRTLKVRSELKKIIN